MAETPRTDEENSSVREIYTDKAPTSSAPLSQAIQAGDFLFISGQVPRMPTGELLTGDFEAEVRLALDNVKAIVEAAGGSLDQICKVVVYLPDVSLLERFNVIYRQFFLSGPLPARTTVGCALARPDFSIEIEAVAWLRT